MARKEKELLSLSSCKSLGKETKTPITGQLQRVPMHHGGQMQTQAPNQSPGFFILAPSTQLGERGKLHEFPDLARAP